VYILECYLSIMRLSEPGYLSVLIDRTGMVWSSGFHSKTMEDARKEISERYRKGGHFTRLTYPYWVIVKDDPHNYKPVGVRRVVDASSRIKKLRGKTVETVRKYIHKHPDPKLEAEFIKYVKKDFEKHKEELERDYGKLKK
ncbi:MAG: hypothetical protein ACP5OE_10190, partial [Thermodesulfobium sp.]